MTTEGTRRGRPSGAATAIIVVLALGLGGWVVLNSAFFAIRDVRVEGASNVSADEIRSLAAIRSGANLILLPHDEVSARIEVHPWVLDAEVVRELPTTAVIRVTERTPSGWMEDPEGMAIVSGDGVVLERITVPPPQLPAVGSSPDPLAVGDRLGSTGQPLRVAASMGGPLRERIAAVELQGSDVLLRLREGGTVLYGEPVELSAKNGALAEMLRWANGQGIEVGTIDVRAPSAPSLEPLRVGGGPTPSPTP